MGKLREFIRDIREIADWIRLQRQVERMRGNADFAWWYADKFNSGCLVDFENVIRYRGLDRTLEMWREFESRNGK